MKRSESREAVRRAAYPGGQTPPDRVLVRQNWVKKAGTSPKPLHNDKKQATKLSTHDPPLTVLLSCLCLETHLRQLSKRTPLTSWHHRHRSGPAALMARTRDLGRPLRDLSQTTPTRHQSHCFHYHHRLMTCWMPLKMDPNHDGTKRSSKMTTAHHYHCLLHHHQPRRQPHIRRHRSAHSHPDQQHDRAPLHHHGHAEYD